MTTTASLTTYRVQAATGSCHDWNETIVSAFPSVRGRRAGEGSKGPKRPSPPILTSSLNEFNSFFFCLNAAFYTPIAGFDFNLTPTGTALAAGHRRFPLHSV